MALNQVKSAEFITDLVAIDVPGSYQFPQNTGVTAVTELRIETGGEAFILKPGQSHFSGENEIFNITVGDEEIVKFDLTRSGSIAESNGIEDITALKQADDVGTEVKEVLES